MSSTPHGIAGAVSLINMLHKRLIKFFLDKKDTQKILLSIQSEFVIVEQVFCYIKISPLEIISPFLGSGI